MTKSKCISKEIIERMQKEEFEDMWDQSVYPLIIKCDKELDAHFKSAASLSIKNLDSYRNDLGNLYLHKRNWLKREYLPYDSDPTLDFHKLSAVMCRCIIGNKPFVFDKNIARLFIEKTHQEQINGEDKRVILKKQIDNVYVNYKLAFLVSESIAFTDLVQWVQRQIKNITEENKEYLAYVPVYKSFLMKLDEKGVLINYESDKRQHDPFFESMINCLIKNDILKRDFDYLFFAANMFQWQEYTKRTILSEIAIDDEISIDSSLFIKGFTM